jgi:uncharacterized protein YfbU (UPF0304 family)
VKEAISRENYEDFWVFSLDPNNRKKMDIIAKGAKIFATKLKVAFDREKENQSDNETIQYVEYEAYPMDTFSVIVSFGIGNRHISLNLEDIKFLGIEFEAEQRIYVWSENGERKVEHFPSERKRYRLELSEVEKAFKEMYERISRTLKLPNL